MSEVFELIPQEKKKNIETAIALCNSYSKIIIRTPEEYQNAANVRKQMTDSKKSLEVDRTSIVKPLNDQVGEVNAEFKRATSAIDNAVNVLNNALTTYDDEQERIWQEAQRKAAAEAEEARRKAEAAAEAIRKQAEEKATEERRKAEELAAQGKEKEAAAALAKADKIEEKAEAKADSVEDKAYSAPVPIFVKPKASGLSFRVKLRGAVIDKATAVAALMANPGTAGCIEINMTALEKIQNAMAGKLPTPGVSWTEEKTAVGR